MVLVETVFELNYECGHINHLWFLYLILYIVYEESGLEVMFHLHCNNISYILFIKGLISENANFWLFLCSKVIILCSLKIQTEKEAIHGAYLGVVEFFPLKTNILTVHHCGVFLMFERRN